MLLEAGHERDAAGLQRASDLRDRVEGLGTMKMAAAMKVWLKMSSGKALRSVESMT
jgi:hypothetical protein